VVRGSKGAGVKVGSAPGAPERERHARLTVRTASRAVVEVTTRPGECHDWVFLAPGGVCGTRLETQQGTALSEALRPNPERSRQRASRHAASLTAVGSTLSGHLSAPRAGGPSALLDQSLEVLKVLGDLPLHESELVADLFYEPLRLHV
jgi:hypothetical protein